jgi:hypothetical protein
MCSVLSINASSEAEFPKSIYRGLESCYSSLVLWAQGYGIADGELDVLLEQSQELRHMTLGLLVSISKTLVESMLPVV